MKRTVNLCALAVMLWCLPAGCGGDENGEAGDDAIGDALEESWSVEWSGPLTGSASGESVVLTEKAALMRHDIGLGYDGAPVRVLLTVNNLDEGTISGTDVVLVKLELDDEGQSSSAALSGEVNVTQHDAQGTRGTFQADVICVGSSDMPTLSVTGSFSTASGT